MDHELELAEGPSAARAVGMGIEDVLAEVHQGPHRVGPSLKDCLIERVRGDPALRFRAERPFGEAERLVP